MSSSKNRNTFDVIVIGAGSGGLNIAGFMNRAGFRVLLIDKDERSIGGDCLNYGCVPSKALIHAARRCHDAFTAQEFGVSVNGAPDISRVMEYVASRQQVIRAHENADYFRAQGMEVALGSAAFTGPDTVAVAGREYRGKKIVLATGSRPRTLSIPGSADVPVFTNETIFSIDFLPEHVVFVGGGPINCELGQAFRYLGSGVTIVERGGRILPKEDEEIVAPLAEHMQSEGISIKTDASIRAVGNGNAELETAQGAARVPCDALFIGIGREPVLDGLSLEQAGIRTKEGKLIVNDYLETTNPRVLACGDVAGGYQFTHAAELHATAVIRNFFSPFKRPLNTVHMAWVTYTNPEIATFGRSAAGLAEKGKSYRTIVQPFTDNDRAIIDSYQDGLLKLHISPSGRILGGSMVAPRAGELVQELILAESHGLSVDDLFGKVYPYPTAARINREAAGSVLGEKLSGWRKRLLHLLF